MSENAMDAARRFAVETWGTTWTDAEMGALLEFAALAAQPPKEGGAGAGWKLVPVEPTEEMVQAGWIDKEDVDPDDIYHAMLAAAPNPPAGGSVVTPQPNDLGKLSDAATPGLLTVWASTDEDITEPSAYVTEISGIYLVASTPGDLSSPDQDAEYLKALWNLHRTGRLVSAPAAPRHEPSVEEIARAFEAGAESMRREVIAHLNGVANAMEAKFRGTSGGMLPADVRWQAERVSVLKIPAPPAEQDANHGGGR